MVCVSKIALMVCLQFQVDANTVAIFVQIVQMMLIIVLTALQVYSYTKQNVCLNVL